RALRKAFEGWGTCEKAIISILGHRNAAQRRQIRAAYEELFHEDLVKRLESELKGDFEKAVYRWILDPEDRDAVLANVAIKKSGDYHVIAEIACVLSPEELLAVRRAYQARYKHSLEEDVAAHTSGDLRKACLISTRALFEQIVCICITNDSDDDWFLFLLVWQLLVGLVTAYRYQGTEVNARLANSDADILHDAIKDKAFNHEEVIRILTTRSKVQLLATFNRYRDDHGTSLHKALSGEHEDFKTVLNIAVRCIRDHKKYFEEVLRNVIKRVGTDEDALTRVIVTRAEKDLKDIKDLYYKENSTDEKAITWILGHRNATQRKEIRDTYQHLYNESLIDRLHSELSGDFGKAVILWAHDPPVRDAKLANKALNSKKKGIKQLQVIVEIACASSPHHLLAVRQAYCSRYDCSLEEDISSSVSLPLSKILVGLVSSYRYDKEVVDTSIANSEAAMLREVITRKQLDNDDLVHILATRNFYQLRATFDCYKQQFGNPIDQDIKSCGDGDLESLWRVIILCIESPEKHFAQGRMKIH
ncbi:hypothetical protein Tsubulata_019270, partial [Turnera subulata]